MRSTCSSRSMQAPNPSTAPKTDGRRVEPEGFPRGAGRLMPDIVYVLTNEAMPGLVKIGLTTDSVEARLTTLSSATGVPLPFECYFAAEVGDSVRVERILHQLFAESRINPRREFF